MTANEEFFDAMVRHQIGLLRLSGRVRNKVLKVLDATEKDIARQIRERVPSPGVLFDSRLRTLLRSIRSIRQQAWVESAEIWRQELLAIAKAEPDFVEQALRTTAPVQLEIFMPSPSTLRSIVLTRPFEGQVLHHWAKTIRASDIRRIEQQIRIGIAQGETGAAIARRVVGTARQKGRNGVTEITRRQSEAITRTAINAITNQAKREFFKDNAHLFEEELYAATLDSRTTPICRALDGKKFPVGKGAIPPLHFNCRSVRIALIDGKAIGDRPARAFTQRQLIQEYNRKNGTSATSRVTLPRGHKGPFDAFKRERIRDLTGQVDAKITYQQWLSRQSADFQNDILGPTRGKLFRRGGLALARFVNRRGDEINLSDLARRDADAFRAAGLDPDNFK